MSPFLQQLASSAAALTLEGSIQAKVVAVQLLGDVAALLAQAGDKGAADKALGAVAALVYKAVFAVLQQKDVLDDLKNAAIETIATVLAGAAPFLPAKSADECVAVLLERIDNDSTRVAVLRSLARLAIQVSNTGGKHLSLKSLAGNGKAVALIASFLRKNIRAVKVSTCECLHALIVAHAADGALAGKDVELVLGEVAAQAVDADLGLAAHCLSLASAALTVLPAVGATSALSGAGANACATGKSLFSRALDLAVSKLLEPATQFQVSRFFGACVASKAKPLALPAVVDALSKLIPANDANAHLSLALRAREAVAASLAAAVLAAKDAGETQRLLKEFTAELGSKGATVARKHLALCFIGFVGREDKSIKAAELEQTVMKLFADPDGEVRAAAAGALGHLALCTFRASAGQHTTPHHSTAQNGTGQD